MAGVNRVKVIPFQRRALRPEGFDKVILNFLCAIPAFLGKQLLVLAIALICSFISMTSTLIMGILSLASLFMGTIALIALVAFIVVGGVAWLGHAKIAMSHWIAFGWTAGLVYLGLFVFCAMAGWLVASQAKFIQWLKHVQASVIGRV